MKSITEFNSYNLSKGLEAKTALTGEGKTPEEIQENLGTTFKLEGDKLKHFVNALEVAAQNVDGLSRVLVVTLNEGENAPPKAVKVEESHYVPEFRIQAKTTVATKNDVKGGGRGKGGPGGGRGPGGGGPKESPWGLSPEQKAAKKGAGGGGAKANKPG